MFHASFLRKYIAVVMILSFINLLAGIAPLQASMVQTSEIFKQQRFDSDKMRLLKILEREKVQQKLQSWGVDPQEAKKRINALTEEELARMSEKMDELPAGGDGLGTVVGAAVFIFIVLLITDILGYTEIFTFVKR